MGITETGASGHTTTTYQRSLGANQLDARLSSPLQAPSDHMTDTNGRCALA